MIVFCEDCGHRYVIEDPRLSETSAQFNCKICNHLITIETSRRSWGARPASGGDDDRSGPTGGGPSSDGETGEAAAALGEPSTPLRSKALQDTAQPHTQPASSSAMDIPAVNDSGNAVIKWCADIIDMLPLGVYRTTIEGNIVYGNRHFARLFGFDSVRQLIERPVIELYQDKRQRGEFVAAILEAGYVQDFHVRCRNRQNEPFECTITARAVYDEDGLVAFIDGIISAIGMNREDSFSAVRRADDAQPAAEKFQGVLEMAGGVAHRINQPLMIINNLLGEVLSEIDQDDKIYIKINRIKNQLDKMNEIARKILDIKTYETMDYVGGVKIVDLDKASIETSPKDRK